MEIEYIDGLIDFLKKRAAKIEVPEIPPNLPQTEEYLLMRRREGAIVERSLRFESGLSATEFERIENTYGIMFPPDLRALLERAVPVTDPYPASGRGPFPSWRDLKKLKDDFGYPTEVILDDICEGDFWPEEWGGRPADRSNREKIGRERMLEIPRMIPVREHQYLPSEPCETGNPVFSIYWKDSVYAGRDLADYFHSWFGTPLPEWSRRTFRRIRFWSEVEPEVPTASE